MINISIKDGKMDAYVSGSREQLMIELDVARGLIAKAFEGNGLLDGPLADKEARRLFCEAMVKHMASKIAAEQDERDAMEPAAQTPEKKTRKRRRGWRRRLAANGG